MRLLRQYWLHGLIFAFLAAGLGQAFAPYLEAWQQGTMKKVLHRAVALDLEELDAQLDAPGENPTLLFLYASWCPACKTVMPLLIDRLRKQGKQPIQPLFVAIEDTPQALNDYLLRQRIPDLFTAYVVNKKELPALAELLHKNAVSFNGELPFIALFNETGEMVGQWHGEMTRDEFTQLLQRLEPFPLPPLAPSSAKK